METGGCGPSDPRIADAAIARLRDIADRAPVAVLVKDEAGRYRFVNRWALELIGRALEDVVGRTARELLPEPLARRVEAHDRAAAEAGPVRREEEEELVPTPGGERALMVVRLPFPLGGGETGTLAIGVDVTERRRAEAALRESEERFRLLADAIPQIVCVLAPDGTPEYVNPGWVEFSGLDLEATRRVGLTPTVHPDDAPAALEALRRARRRLAEEDVELRYRAADGTYRWFLCRLAPVVRDGRVSRIVGAGMDIEGHRRAEAALREQLALKDQLAKVAESVPGVICSFRLRPDGSACMEFSAPAIEDLYGIPQGELARSMAPVFARMHPDDLARVQATIAESRRTLSPWHAEFRYDHPAKGLRWIEGKSIPAAEPDGSVLWHGYVVDVTDRKRADEALRTSEERLRRANAQLVEAAQRKDQFLGVLSHELRNPLAPIRTALHVLERLDAGGEAARGARAVASRQVNHLARLVEDLLDVTRIARGKIRLRRSELDLAVLARRAADDHAELMRARGVALELELPQRPIVVSVDETRVVQVLGNLLQNAAKFTPAGGQVTLAAAEEDGRAVVRVRDTGRGIPPELLEAVFDPFTQGQQTLARSEGGLGLGLALVKGIVELHGGEVAARSGGPGTGAEFVVRLPLQAAPRAGAAPRTVAAGPGVGGRRVLVVDDNRDQADVLADFVRLLGHEVEVAYDGPSAVALARARRPDVVLCDIGLPGMDGYEVARVLRRDAPGARLVAVSGYALPDDVARALEAGFERHLAKPPDLDEVAALLG